MRTLLLLRHAKSSWADSTLPDHDRPLAPRGVRAAKRIANHLRAEAVPPAIVLCSSARRARHTLDALRPSLDEGTVISTEDGLYGADADALLDRLRAVDPEIGSVMVIGHNPGLEDLAVRLAGDGDHAALAQVIAAHPGGAMARLHHELDSRPLAARSASRSFTAASLGGESVRDAQHLTAQPPVDSGRDRHISEAASEPQRRSRSKRQESSPTIRRGSFDSRTLRCGAARIRLMMRLAPGS